MRRKFDGTDFEHQKRALRTSFHVLLLFAEERSDPAALRYMDHLAERHGARQMDIGAELYDLWLDALLETVKENDPRFDHRIEEAWERVMGLGIKHLLSRYNEA